MRRELTPMLVLEFKTNLFLLSKVFTIKILLHDIEHRSITNIFKNLEDSQYPHYMLQSILEWAYNAKVNGFDFNPKAATRKANIAWMYQALEKVSSAVAPCGVHRT
jgi:hypothetical protein